MAPEQAAGKVREIGPLVDVYALGAILYEMLTGRPPFRGESPAGTTQQVISQEPVPPSRLNSKVPRDLETICLKCLEKDPLKRYQSAEVLRGRLELFLGGTPIPDRPIGKLERLWRWCKRNRILAATGGVSVLLLIAIAVLSVIFGLRQRQSAAELQVALKESRRQEVLSSWDRARQLCEEGEVGHGLLAFANALERIPEGPEDDDLREVLSIELAGWHRHCHTLKQVLGHPDKVLAMAVSPDGKTVVSGCADGGVRAWDLKSGKCRWPPAGHEGEVRAVAFSPDGDFFITGGTDHKVLVWKTVTGQRICSLDGHSGTVCAVAVSPDGHFALTGGLDKEARLWNLPERTCATVLKHEGAVLTVGFRPDGRSFFIGGETRGSDTGKLCFYNTLTAGCEALTFLATESDAKFRLTSAAFSPDGNTLLVGDENWVASFYDAASFQLFATTDYGLGIIRGVGFSPDGNTALIGADDSNIAMLWDVAKLRAHWEKQQRGSVVLTEEGPPRPLFPLLPHPQPVTAVSFVPPDGKLFLTACQDGYIRVWQKAPGPSIKVLDHHPRMESHKNREHVVRATAIDPSGQLAATAGDNGKVRFWDVPTGKPIGQDLDCSSPVMSFVFTSDGQSCVTGSKDGRIRLWDARRRKEIGSPMSHQGGVSGLSISRDQDLILVGGSGKAQRWNVRTGVQIGNPLQHTADDPERSVATAISPNNERFLTMGEDGKAKLWDKDGGLIAELEHGNEVRDGGFSHDATRAITASDDRTARVWNAHSGALILTLTHRSDVSSAAFLTGHRTLTSSRQGAQVWDLRFQRRIGPSCKYNNDVLDVACSSDGKTAVLADWNGYGVIWSMPQPLPVDPKVITAWVETEVGMKLDNGGGRQVLSGQAWLTTRETVPNLPSE
jgi:WD40 repeat protein